MSQTRPLSEEDVEEYDDYLYREERAGFADTVEWFFGSAFYLLTMLFTPWRWFRQRPEGIDMLEGQSEVLQREPSKPPLLWRMLDFSETATSRTGFGFSYLFDMIEMFFARSFELLVFLITPWRWFRRTPPRRSIDQNF